MELAGLFGGTSVKDALGVPGLFSTCSDKLGESDFEEAGSGKGPTTGLFGWLRAAICIRRRELEQGLRHTRRRVEEVFFSLE